VRQEVIMSWSELKDSWKRVFELSWEAYTAGTIPIGAVIVDEEDRVVAVARNRILDRSPVTHQIYGHKLAHAEINAILQVDEAQHPGIRDYTLYTAMEPCPLCIGAAVMGNIRHIVYAAADRYAGATCLCDAMEYMARRNIAVEGPFEPMQTFEVALQTCYELETRPETAHYIASTAWGSCCPGGVVLAERLYADGVFVGMRARGATAQAVYDDVMGLADECGYV
jgi:tRNA(adenine34) deaminase